MIPPDPLSPPTNEIFHMFYVFFLLKASLTFNLFSMSLVIVKDKSVLHCSCWGCAWLAWNYWHTWQIDRNKLVVVQFQVQKIPRVWSNICCLRSLSGPGILSPYPRSLTCSSCRRWWSSGRTRPRACSCAGWTGSGWSSSWTPPRTPPSSWEVECTRTRTRVQ